MIVQKLTRHAACRSFFLIFTYFLLISWNKQPVFGQVFDLPRLIHPITPIQPEPIDFDGDGDTDILLVDKSHWIENLGNGEFAGIKPVPLYALVFSVVDFDLDGFRDLVFKKNSQLFWQKNLDGKGKFGNPILIGDLPGFLSSIDKLLPADLDGDEDMDLTFSARTGNHIYWYQNGGDSQNFSRVDFELKFDPINGPSSAVINCLEMALLDVDKNGILDFVTHHEGGNWRHLMTTSNLGNGNFEPFLQVNTWVIPYRWWYDFRQTADFDGDKVSELLRLDNFAGLNIFCTPRRTFINIQNGTTTETIDTRETCPGASVPDMNPLHSNFTPIDADNDGRKDIVSAAGRQLFLNLNLGNFDFETAPVFDSTALPGDLAGAMTAADLDGDGAEDLIGIEDGRLVWFKNRLGSKPLANLRAKVFFDKNSNGKRDPDENFLLQQKIEASPQFENHQSGDGELTEIKTLSQGIVQLTCSLRAGWMATTPTFVKFSLAGDTSIYHEFGARPTKPQTQASLDLATGHLRCGQIAPIFLTIENTGTSEDSIRVSLQLSDLTKFVAADPPVVSFSTDSLIWDLPPLPPTHQRKIKIWVKTAEASWQGQEIRLQHSLVLLDTFGSQVFSSSGHFSSDLSCSLASNEKLAMPNPVSADTNYLHPDEELIYTIRFQNTGDEPVFSLKITDQLDSKLDFSSLRIISASHSNLQYSFGRTAGFLTFEFPKINLAAAKSDSLASQGFVKFGLQLKSGLPEMAEILNRANIFFNQNSPVPTNLTKTFATRNRFVFKIRHVCEDTARTGRIEVFDLQHRESDLVFEWKGFPQNTSSVLADLWGGKFSLKIYEKPLWTLVFDANLGVLNSKLYALTNVFDCTAGLSNGAVSLILPSVFQPYTYLWNTIPPQTSFGIYNLAPGNYACTVTSWTGCSKIFTAEVGEQAIGTDEVLASLNFEILPNPNAGDFQIRLATEQPLDFQIQIFNSLGVLEKTISSGAGQRREQVFQVEKQGVGLHFVRVESGGRFFTKKVVVE